MYIRQSSPQLMKIKYFLNISKDLCLKIYESLELIMRTNLFLYLTKIIKDLCLVLRSMCLKS